MPRLISSILLYSIVVSGIYSQSIIITEVNQSEQWVELQNVSSTESVDVSKWILWDHPFYSIIGDNPFVKVLSGDLVMRPNSFLVLEWISINANDGEIALFSSDDFDSATSMQDYIQYHRGGHSGAEMAVKIGVWDDVSAYVPNTKTLGQSLVMNDAYASSPMQTDSKDWIADDSSKGVANFAEISPCSSQLLLNELFVAASSYQAINIIANGTVDDIETETKLIAQEGVEFMIDFQVEHGATLVVTIEQCQ